MKKHIGTLGPLIALVAFGFQGQVTYSQETTTPGNVQVHMVITNEALQVGDDTPVLKPENVQVRQGRNSLKVTHVIPAQGDSAGLQLFILIDDTCETSSLGNNLNDIRDFVNAQPATTAIAIGYMSNANVQITQDFTADHSLVAKAIRLPLGRLSAQDSPYLSLMSLLRRWPEGKIRREIIMVTDGIDRLRGTREATNFGSMQSSRNQMGMPSNRNLAGGPPSATSMPIMPIDADSASQLSQRNGVIIHGIYSPGVGRVGRNAWEAQMGQSGIGKITDETGGEYFALGFQMPVSFKPFFDRLQKVLDNQYYLVFEAVPQKKAGLQRVRISSEAATTEIAAANNVWVPLKTEASSSGN
jgi:hypothetical protein